MGKAVEIEAVEVPPDHGLEVLGQEVEVEADVGQVKTFNFEMMETSVRKHPQQRQKMEVDDKSLQKGTEEGKKTMWEEDPIHRGARIPITSK